MSYEIKVMTMDDYDAIYDMWSHMTGMSLNNVDDSPEGMDMYIRRNPNTSFVAYEDGVLVGAIMAGHDGRRGYIHHTSVKESERRRGIGKALLEHTMEALEKEGISKVALVAFATNEGGNAFWEQQGFTDRPDLTYRNKRIKPANEVHT